MTGVDVSRGAAEEVMVLDNIFIPGTKQTPEISCNNISGEVSFKGNFISSNPNELLEPIQKWLYAFIKVRKSVGLTLAFHLTYLNCTSGKSLCKLFQQAEEIQDRGSTINIQLYYEDDDLDMLEWCKEMKNTYKLQFSLSKVN
ncbi:MAG: DUF1987 domain-containing protein [Bacteroidales bacterium]|nr:MAG: DUF1987 domain-containing protein [Bacteroidales bacterium]